MLTKPQFVANGGRAVYLNDVSPVCGLRRYTIVYQVDETLQTIGYGAEVWRDHIQDKQTGKYHKELPVRSWKKKDAFDHAFKRFVEAPVVLELPAGLVNFNEDGKKVFDTTALNKFLLAALREHGCWRRSGA